MDHLKQFSLCARFKTFRYLDLYKFKENKKLSNQLVFYLGRKNPFFFHSRVTKISDGKNISGRIYFNKKEWIIPVWKLNVWNKFCLKIDNIRNILSFTFNENEVIQKLQFDEKPDTSGNIFLLNYEIKSQFLSNDAFLAMKYGSSWCPMYGAIADLHIWDRIVTEKNEFPDFNTSHIPGNIVSWESAQLKTKFMATNSEISFPNNPVIEGFR